MTAGFAPAHPTDACKSNPSASSNPARRVAYVMSRFPKLTETFVLDEILELERRGVAVEVFPLWRERADVIHAEARPVVDRAHFTPTLDFAILRDNLRCFLASPGLYLGTLSTLVGANWRSARFLVAALVIFPKACHFALRMRALGVQHVHAHFASHPAAAAFIVGRLAGVPWSFTAHGSDLHREQSMLAEKVAEARFVVAISEFNRRFILERVGERFADRVCVIHCGVDPKRFSPRRASSEAASQRLEIACIGTLHAVKGQRFLLEACAVLSQRGIEWRCHLIGDGPDRRALEARCVELGLQERVVFHGRCERERVRALLAEMDAVVAPSVPTWDGRREGIPVVLMEAAASGLPLVASRLSGIPELVEDDASGLLVEPADVQGLTEALARLSAEPATRARLGASARQRLEESFCLERNVGRLCERIFESVPA
jgi:glycosyltransferase involved in cell wall biosynthesis